MDPNLCPVCNSRNTAFIIEIAEMPVYCNRLWTTREKALAAPKGDIRLRFCRDCGHFFNAAFDPQLLEYDKDYENSLHFSPRFQTYAEQLAHRLVEDYDLHDKDVVEIGCGKGDFLALLCALGPNRGLGFDSSYEDDRATVRTGNHLRVINDYFSERYNRCPADLICCRQVLEHIQNPHSFLKSVRRTIGDRTESIVFFEVPDFMYTLKDMGIWDLIYEHCGYFSNTSLNHLFRTCGFEVLKIQPGFEGQFLCIDARPVSAKDLTTELVDKACVDLDKHALAFTDKYRDKVNHWEAELERLRKDMRKTVIWGGGSKGVTFLNVIQNSHLILYVVDINPYKKGRFVPGTGQKIVPPEFLANYEPDIIFVMNPNYLKEVQTWVHQLNIAPLFMAV